MEEAVLERLGLDKREAKVYLVLLSLGTSTVSLISRKTKIERTQVYRILDLLIDKGLVSFVTENRTRKFSASDPEKILFQLKEKEAAFMEILPKLRKISSAGEKEEPSVEVYRGTRGMKAMVNEILKIKKDYCVLCGDYRTPSLSIFFTHFMKEIEKQNIHEKVLIRRGSDIVRSKNTEVRFLPENYSFLSTTGICGDMVGIVIWSKPFLGISIKSKELASTYMNYFKLLWGISKK